MVLTQSPHKDLLCLCIFLCVYLSLYFLAIISQFSLLHSRTLQHFRKGPRHKTRLLTEHSLTTVPQYKNWIFLQKSWDHQIYFSDSGILRDVLLSFLITSQLHGASVSGCPKSQRQESQGL